MGREVFEAALKNPDSLAESQIRTRIQNELFGYVAGIVYELLTGGQQMPDNTSVKCRPNPFGKRSEWEGIEQYRRRLPKLWAKFGERYERVMNATTHPINKHAGGRETILAHPFSHPRLEPFTDCGPDKGSPMRSDRCVLPAPRTTAIKSPTPPRCRPTKRRETHSNEENCEQRNQSSGQQTRYQ